MKIPPGFQLVSERNQDAILKPYDLLNDINGKSQVDLDILGTWVDHLKVKDEPYLVVECRNKIILYVQETERIQASRGWHER